MTSIQSVFAVNGGGVPRQLEVQPAHNELRDLQDLLEKNHDLLPGKQINPEDPCRWLLVKREMAVPDPTTGIDRWSIDSFFVDQGAIPTFVECKRRDDTRARREVVAQMLDYAANGSYYWSEELLREHLSRQADQGSLQLEDVLRSLQGQAFTSADDFLKKVRANLEQGILRLVFLLDEAPYELRSIVQFLNNQTERTEFLIVELPQYKLDGKKILVPTLFGYTDEARRIKKEVIVSERRRRWNKESFFADLVVRQPTLVQSAYQVYDHAVERGFTISWGSGKESGSFSVTMPGLEGSVFSVFSSGSITLNFGNFTGTPVNEKFRDQFRQIAMERLSLDLPADVSRKWVTLRPEQWPQYIDEWSKLIDQVADVMQKP